MQCRQINSSRHILRDKPKKAKWKAQETEGKNDDAEKKEKTVNKKCNIKQKILYKVKKSGGIAAKMSVLD